MNVVSTDQTTIHGDKLNPPQPNVPCEWCSEPSVDSKQLMCRVKGKRGGRTPSGMRTYFCDQHREQGERLAEEPIR